MTEDVRATLSPYYARLREQGTWNRENVAKNYLLSVVERGLETVYREAMRERSRFRRCGKMSDVGPPEEASVPIHPNVRGTVERS